MMMPEDSGAVTTSRKSVPKHLRFEILRRDNHACRYCGAVAPDVKLTVDHVVPIALGGSNEPANLVTACADCNNGKSATPADAVMVADVALDALRWAAAMRFAGQQQDQEADDLRAYVEQVDEAWCAWSWTDRDGAKHPVGRPGDWPESCRSWRNAGASTTTVTDAINRALGNKNIRADGAWRYVAGIVWSVLRERQQIARTILDTATGEASI